MNLLEEFGYKEKDIEKKINSAWVSLFEDKSKFYFETENSAYVMDTSTKKAGAMETGIAMTLAVQMDKKDVFDKLWNFAKKNLLVKEGLYKGLITNCCECDGSPVEGSLPTAGAIQWICTALFLAQHRWAPTDEKKAYEKKATSILKAALKKNSAVWDKKSYLPIISGEKDFLYTTELTPHIYSLFAMFADPKSSTFWSNAAEASRKAIVGATDMKTGLYPSILNSDGTPNKKQKSFAGQNGYVMINNAIFTMWFGDSPDLADIAKLQLKFFDKIDVADFKNYKTDGTPSAAASKNPLALCAGIAAASLVVERSHSEISASMRAMQKRAVKRLWNCELTTGKERARENTSYLMALLALSGRFLVY